MNIRFGTSGLRDRYGVVNEDIAISLSSKFADVGVCIGRDTRRNSLPIMLASVSGVLKAGSNARMLGVCPTPTVAVCSKIFNCKGMSITASHNPEEYAGIKLFSNGRELTKGECDLVLDSPELCADWDKLGKKEDVDGIGKHIDEALDYVGYSKNFGSMRVLIDSNGAGGGISKRLFCRMFGADIINDVSEGFARPSEPEPENLSLMISKMGSYDISIAFDGDADRCVAFPGVVIPKDKLIAVMSRHMIESGRTKKVVSTVETSLSLKEFVEDAGGSVITVKVGSPFVALEMEKSGAGFGGEPCGEYIFKDVSLCPDGIVSALMFMEIESEKGISKVASMVKDYPIERRKYRCENKKKAMDLIRDALYSFDGELNLSDGVRIDFDDGWMLVRPSGTEPVIRITAEARSRGVLSKIVESAESVVLNSIRSSRN